MPNKKDNTEEECATKNNCNFSKKYEKIKYQINLQNYKISKLKQEVDKKREKAFPQHCISELEQQLKTEICKLDNMIQLAIQERAQNKNENWGVIPTDIPKTTCPMDESKLKPPKTPSCISNVSGLSRASFTQCNQDSNKSNSMCSLQDKIESMQEQMCKLCEENQQMALKLNNPVQSDAESELKSKLEFYAANAEKLSCNIKKMEDYLKKLRNEMNCLEKESKDVEENCCEQAEEDCCEQVEQEERPPKTSVNVNQHMNKLQIKYLHLLNDYCEKDKQYKDMSERLKKVVAMNEGTKEQAENEMLRHETNRLICETEDYKVLMKELQAQVDLYRSKFLKAQEMFEERCHLLRNLEKTNKQIEDQVNGEIRKIKEKFQQKLSEVCQYPQKYKETAELLEQSMDSIEKLKQELKLKNDDLTKAKLELKNLKDGTDNSTSPKYEKLQCELEQLKKKCCNLQKTKECLEEKMCCMRKELQELRSDSAKILTTTKCYAEKNREILHDQINCLEIELAQCRATATLSISEREEVIKRLTQDLATLCEHFSCCQDQIKQLKDQMIFLTNQNFPHTSTKSIC